jgi:hypothetical protein
MAGDAELLRASPEQQLLLETLSRIGELSADVRNVREAQMLAERRNDAAHADAAASRRVLHEKVDRFGADVCTLKATIGRITPLVEIHETERQQSVGKRKLIGGIVKARHALWGAAAAAAGYFGYHFSGIPRP